MAYFPMFVEISNKKCLIVGGGKIALHKAQVMSDFGAIVYVIAPKIINEIKAMTDVTCYETKIQLQDIENYDIVIAATDDKTLDHSISAFCKEKKIPVNAVDNIEDCSFIFPAYIKQKDVIAAFSSGGKCPVISQYLKEEMQKNMPCYIGDIANCIGNIREDVKARACTEQRKEIYKTILETGIEMQGVPDKTEIEDIIERTIDNATIKQPSKNIY